MASRHGHHARQDGATARDGPGATTTEEGSETTREDGGGTAVGDAALHAIASAVIGQVVTAQRRRDAGDTAGRRARPGKDEGAARVASPLGHRIDVVLPALIAPALLG